MIVPVTDHRGHKWNLRIDTQGYRCPGDPFDRWAVQTDTYLLFIDGAHD